MKNLKPYLVGIFCLCISSSALIAQDRENAFNLQYTYSNPDEDGLQQDFDVHDAKVSALFGVTDYIDVGAVYRANVWQAKEDVIGEIDLHKILLPIYGDIELPNDFTVTLNATPGLHTDYKDVDNDDFQIYGFAEVFYALNPQLTFALGAAYGDEFGDSQWYPVGGIRWQATNELLLNLTVPYPSISYACSEWFRIFAFGEPSGGQWNVGDSNSREFDLEKEGFRVGGGAEVKVAINTWFFLAGGGEFDHDLEVDANGQAISDDELDFDDTGFVRVGLRVTR